MNRHSVPDVIDAFQEAIRCQGSPTRFQWSHPAVYETACQTGFTRLRSETKALVFPAFANHYRETCAKLSRPQSKFLTNPLHQVQKLADWLQIDAAYLYYLTKPEGSSMRQYLRNKSMDALTTQQTGCWLPE